MNIGFDLDKVLINYPPFVPDSLIDKFYKKKANGVLLYRIPSTPEQWLRKLTHIPALRQPVQENLAVLERLSKQNHKLYLISSRFKFLEPETTRLVRKHGIDRIFDGMYFNYENKQPHEFKDDVIKKLHLDMYIDDDVHLLNYVSKHQNNIRFYWLTSERHGQSPSSKIQKIAHLSELFHIS